MRSALFALAVTALAAGLVVGPAIHQPAQASVLGGLKSGAPAQIAGDLILVGKGRGGGGGKGFRGGGGGFKGAHRGGSFKGYRGGGGRHVYRGGGGKRYAYKGRSYPKYWSGGGGKGKKHYNKHYAGKYYNRGRRYYRGRYYDNWWWYGPTVAVGVYGYGGCAWLRRQAVATGDPYWWDRYYNCVGYY